MYPSFDLFKVLLPNQNGIDNLFSNSNPEFFIQPKESIEFSFNRKVERIGVFNDEENQINVLFYDISKNTPAKRVQDTETTLYSGAVGKTYGEISEAFEGMVEFPSQPPDDPTAEYTPTVNYVHDGNKHTIEFNLGYHELETDSSSEIDNLYEYRLTMSPILENLILFVDFVPFIATLNVTDSCYGACDNIDDEEQQLVEGEGVLVTIEGDSSNYLNYEAKANFNQVYKHQLNLVIDKTLKYNRFDYYIYDVVEEYYSDIEPPTSNSFLNTTYTTLRDGNFVYLQYYESQPITSDTGFEFYIEKYKIVSLEMNSNGTAEILTSGLAISDSDQESIQYNTDQDLQTFTILPNTVPNITTNENVGFRRWDDLKMNLIPSAGYYIKSVSLTIDEDQDNEFVDDETNLILANLPDLNDYASAKYLEINSITKNIQINVNFQEKPGVPHFYISPIY